MHVMEAPGADSLYVTNVDIVLVRDVAGAVRSGSLWAPPGSTWLEVSVFTVLS